MQNHPFENPYRFARERCRYFYLRWESLPRWRIFARRRALKQSQRWGKISIRVKEESDASSARRQGSPK